MATVYMVQEDAIYEQGELILESYVRGIFSSLEKADAARKEYAEESDRTITCYHAYPFEVDKA